MRRLVAIVVVAAASVLGAASTAGAQAPPDEPPREAFVAVPTGCPIQQLADVVFVGTVLDTDYRTARFRIDQLRAGDLGQFASQVGEQFLVDVRYGVDTKYLTIGNQYLIGASVPGASASGLLESKVAERPSALGGDEVIGADESDLQCPEVDDPNLTLHTNGTRIDSGLLTPLLDDRRGLMRAVLVASGLVLGGVLAIAAVRWILTGFGRGARAVSRPRPATPRSTGARDGTWQPRRDG